MRPVPDTEAAGFLSKQIVAVLAEVLHQHQQADVAVRGRPTFAGGQLTRPSDFDIMPSPKQGDSFIASNARLRPERRNFH
jgi:hypothetical protein